MRISLPLIGLSVVGLALVVSPFAPGAAQAQEILAEQAADQT